MLSWTNERIMIVVAHPDDEVLGMGASIHRMIQEYGCTIEVVILGEGITSRADQRDPAHWQKELAEHKQHIESARKILGYQAVHIHNFPDNRFDGIELLDLIKVVEQEKRRFRPGIIFTHHGGDTNIDHRRTFEAVVTAIRPMEEEEVHSLFCFEIPSSTEWQAFHAPMPWQPNFFFSVSEENLEAKIQAMEQYSHEKRPFPHPRSPQGLRTLAMRQGVRVGLPLAEAFLLVRHIEK
ncbi:MAG: PIG-L family deacetylase [Bacteroidota bacterium]